jgi:REP element-mobilizing transposase RayT
MPEHVHLLLSEPERGNPSVVMQAIKQGFARRLLGRLRANRDPRQGDLCNQSLNPQHVWQRRFYDFGYELMRSVRKSSTTFTRIR